MKRYMEFTKLERANMAHNEVTELLKYELMEAGVVPQGEPVYLKEETISHGTRTYYRPCLEESYGRDMDCLFATSEEATAFLELNPLYLNTDYSTGLNIATPVAGTSIKTVECISVEENAKLRPKFIDAKAVKSRNEQTRLDYDKSIEEEANTIEYVWADWRECQEMKFDASKVISVWDDYLVNCEGNKVIARNFLLKAYGEDDVREACGFLGIDNVLGCEVAVPMMEAI